MENTTTDILLWQQIKKGDITAFEKLYDIYSDGLLTFALQYTTEPSIAKDAIHDVFLDIYKYRTGLAESVNVKSYLFKITQRNVLKKNKTSQKIFHLNTDYSKLTPKEASFEETLIEEENNLELNAKLAFAMQELTENQRKALFYRFNEDKPYEEIASILGISIESCRTLIYRCLKELRKKL
ncbi:RNA polymerase sigma factor [Flavobacterium sp. S87F.05.LMB.W.Kidney.N]|uniref:RNA polymerase sigma factor n=1 Tax=Flavobacterium sp. S87F.05.LMB.W.Kidney.N TaxID=1278758 RepID=UPI001066F1F1|nr:sigma-70 family RNA polymerase sigma factor [Flavobacterium sp. S87F.05.LMB.W.Kidney.N]TDX11238.1 RNA polymerase sigma factor (sigma-70 family) [Flavobacterium sp. S87F.05.LMB.W.Kidney.N]